jgi:hypothetical protein
MTKGERGLPKEKKAHGAHAYRTRYDFIIPTSRRVNKVDTERERMDWDG